MSSTITPTAAPTDAKTVLVVTPTYNERDNIVRLITLVRENVPEADILVVDDNSPDGTGDAVEEIAAKDPKVHCLHRTAKDGLGRAYIAGFGWGIARRYDLIVQMDADLSHDPKYLSSLLAGAKTHDLTLGSRYVPGGGTENWGLHRRILSRFASRYARTILGMPVKDMTGGYRCWKRHVLEDIDLPSIYSNGYSFIVETLYRAVLRGYTVKEVPIIFTDRINGQSKMSRKVIFESVGMVWRLRANKAKIKNLESGALRRSEPGAASEGSTAAASTPTPATRVEEA